MSGRRVLVGVLLFLLGAGSGWVGNEYWYRSPLRLARVAYRERDFELALNLCKQRLAETRGADGQALLLAARASFELRRYQEAENFFDRAPVQELEDKHRRARVSFELKKPLEAIDHYSRILDQHPNDPTALQHLASILLQENRPKEALSLTRRLIEIPSHRLIGQTMTGMVEFHSNNPGKAVEHLQEALRLSPELHGVPVSAGVVLYWLAEALIQLDRGKEAEPFALRAVELEDTAQACHVVAKALRAQGQHQQATAWLEKALDRDRAYLPALIDLGQGALSDGEMERALKWFRRAEQVAPTEPTVRHNVALTLRRLGRSEEAKKYESPEPKS